MRSASRRLSVHEWRTGSKKPSRKNQELIARAFKHIVPSGWDESPNSPEPLPATEDDGDPSEVTNLESANRLLREIREAAQQPGVTPTTWEKLAAREIAVLKFREEVIRRDALLENDIVRRHPKWARTRERLALAIAKCCPACTAKLMEALNASES